MKLFDNKVQELKYNVLREVATQTWKGYDAFSVFNEIANTLVKKDEPPQSCCIYKDRAIVADRIRLAIGGNKYNPNVVQVINGAVINELGFLSMGLRGAVIVVPFTCALYLKGKVPSKAIFMSIVLGPIAVIVGKLIGLSMDPIFIGIAINILCCIIGYHFNKNIKK